MFFPNSLFRLFQYSFASAFSIFYVQNTRTNVIGIISRTILTGYISTVHIRIISITDITCKNLTFENYLTENIPVTKARSSREVFCVQSNKYVFPFKSSPYYHL